jgi:hypothetical protein
MLAVCGMQNPCNTLRLPPFRHGFLAALSLGLVALTPRTAEALTLTLDDPHPVIVIPDSGSLVHTFTGTLSFDRGFTWSAASLYFPFIDGALPVISGGSIINAPYTAAENEGIFSGGLFSFIINSTDLPGFYNQAFGGGPATFSIEVWDGINQVSVEKSYTITLVDSARVPDGGVTSLLWLGALGTLGWFHRRGLQA